MRRLLLPCLVSGLALLASACGGGSGNEPLTPTQLFDGRYVLVSLSPEVDAVYSYWTTMLANGDGRADVSVSWLAGEGISSMEYGEPTDTPYTVADDLSFALGGSPGRMSSGGRAFTLSIPATGSSPAAAALGLRVQELRSMDQLLGFWRSVSIQRGTDDDPHMIATTGRVRIDHVEDVYDLFTTPTRSNMDGTIGVGPFPTTREVLDLAGGHLLRVRSAERGSQFGSLSQDGDVIIFWGRLDDPMNASLRVLVREGRMGQLSGTYSVTGLRSLSDNLVVKTSGTLSMSSSSAGRLQEGGIDIGGLATATAARTGQDLDLTFDGDVAGTQTVRGFMNETGTFGVFSGPITPGDRPHIRFLIK